MKNVKSEPITISRLFYKAAQRKIPISGCFELSPICNMKCKMCYVHESDNDGCFKNRLKTKDEWIKYARAARDNGMLFLLLTGGEPLLYPEFSDVYTECIKMGLMVSVNSNATLINEKNVFLFKEFPPVRINISLYGSSNETYERLSGIKNGYDLAMKGINALLDNKINVKINATMSKYNACDFDSIYAFADRNSLPVLSGSYLFPRIRIEDNIFGQCPHRLSPREAAQLDLKYDKLRFTEDIFKIRMNNILNGVRDCEESDESECSSTDSEEGKMRCRAGKCSFWITWEGKMTFCSMLPGNEISLFDNSFSDAWKETCRLADGILTPSGCLKCPKKVICPSCAAKIYSETGRTDKVPEYFCEYTDCLIAEYRQIKEQQNESQ